MPLFFCPYCANGRGFSIYGKGQRPTARGYGKVADLPRDNDGKGNGNDNDNDNDRPTAKDTYCGAI